MKSRAGHRVPVCFGSLGTKASALSAHTSLQCVQEFTLEIAPLFWLFLWVCFPLSKKSRTPRVSENYGVG